MRRQLLDIVEIPATSRQDLIGTRGRALAKYSDQLSPSDFAKLAFLMRNLSPTSLIFAGHIDWVLSGYPSSRPLFDGG